jgi:DNA-binding CsgD family transcriptional regulator
VGLSAGFGDPSLRARDQAPPCSTATVLAPFRGPSAEPCWGPSPKPSCWLPGLASAIRRIACCDARPGPTLPAPAAFVDRRSTSRSLRGMLPRAGRTRAGRGAGRRSRACALQEVELRPFGRKSFGCELELGGTECGRGRRALADAAVAPLRHGRPGRPRRIARGARASARPAAALGAVARALRGLRGLLAADAGPSSAGELTPREREIGWPAASGLTMRRIAERLVLSVRTVANTCSARRARGGAIAQTVRQSLAPARHPRVNRHTLGIARPEELAGVLIAPDEPVESG